MREEPFEVTDLIRFAILGLGAGAIYALLAHGIVLIYVGSGIVNFAQGAMAMFGAYIFWDLHHQRGWAFPVAVLVAVVTMAVFGALVHLLVMRPLRTSSPLIRVFATLGVMTVLTAVVQLHWGGDFERVPTSLPREPWSIGSIRFSSDRIWLLVIVAVITLVVAVVYKYTRFGLAVAAAAEDEEAAAALGWSPDVLAVVNWALGGALAAVAGILIVPITGLSVGVFTLIIIAALAAALLGGFRSFTATFLAGLLIGILQSWTQFKVTEITGASDAVPFLVVMIVLVVRGRALPLRSHVLDKLPQLGANSSRRRVVLAMGFIAVVAGAAFPDRWNYHLITSFSMAAVILSVVVLTGFAGQVSLAQFALAGLGALIAGRLTASHGFPLEVAIAVGVLGAAVIGSLFALPALRTRGINLAIVTLALGVVVQASVLGNSDYTGGAEGLSVGRMEVFGIDIDRLDHPGRYAVFVIALLTLAVIMVINIRRGTSGRRLIAVRTNERAAASLGVNVFQAKIYAFAVSAAIAGLGGCLIAFQNRVALYDSFNPLESINLVLLAVIGGVGYATGAIHGSVLATGGIGALVADWIGLSGDWLLLVSGVILLIQLTTLPGGLASLHDRKSSRQAPVHELGEVTPSRVRGARLEVSDVSVTFGTAQVVHGVDLHIEPGEIVGLIGPNGAGKTTLIDAITGFVKPSAGSIELDGHAVRKWSPAKRARAGLSRTWQSLELFEDLSVYDNIVAGADRGEPTVYLTDLVWPREEQLPSSAVRAIREFELEDELGHLASELPYGRRRLASIARALAASPSILMLDEPAAGLSDTESEELITMLRRLADDWGIGVLLVEHDMRVVMGVCDRIVVLDLGHVIAEGTPEEISTDDLVLDAYLGHGASETGSIDVMEG